MQKAIRNRGATGLTQIKSSSVSTSTPNSSNTPTYNDDTRVTQSGSLYCPLSNGDGNDQIIEELMVEYKNLQVRMNHVAQKLSNYGVKV